MIATVPIAAGSSRPAMLSASADSGMADDRDGAERCQAARTGDAERPRRAPAWSATATAPSATGRSRPAMLSPIIEPGMADDRDGPDRRRQIAAGDAERPGLSRVAGDYATARGAASASSATIIAGSMPLPRGYCISLKSAQHPGRNAPIHPQKSDHKSNGTPLISGKQIAE